MNKVVHLPCYKDNPYQELLMSAQRELGWEVIDGGGGGNFIGVALRDWKPDVVHFHWLHPYLLRGTWVGSVVRSARFLLEVLILKLRGSRIAWTIHNLSNHDGRYAGMEGFFTAFFARLVDVPITHTREAGRLAAREFGCSERSLFVTRHPGYTSYYPNTVTRTEARRRFGYGESEMVFIFLGRIQPYKGIFDLITAFASLPEQCRLVIAGTPADGETKKRIAGASVRDPRIQFHPDHVSREEVQWFFQSADCVVFPFRKILSSGSVMQRDLDCFLQIFPETTIHRRHEMDDRMADVLQKFPRCRDYRNRQPHGLKCFDIPEICECSKYLMIDPDALFFSPPGEILNWTEDTNKRGCWFNRDFQEPSPISPAQAVAELGVPLWPCVNTGLCLLDRQRVRNLDAMEEWLGPPALQNPNIQWRVEQTLLALCASQNGVGGLLSEDYEVSPHKNRRTGSVSRHYIGCVRDRFYSEGILDLHKSLFN